MKKFKTIQSTELFAITQACELARGKAPSIYTDSRCAFRVVRGFGPLWKQRILNTKWCTSKKWISVC